ncbi:MAG: hypothetical protein J5803_00410 [Desulfovibrio sp.]|nr:hypothetical protein [Desulfovibrio sp.]
MSRHCFLLLLLFLLCTPFVTHAKEIVQDDSLFSSNNQLVSLNDTRSLQRRHLREARAYRANGRYEMARQSYLLALSISSDEKTVREIRKELDGLELMLRTLR